MRILVAHDVGRSRTGGMSRIMGFLHDEVAACGHEVDYFCAEDAPAAPLHRSFRRFSYPLAVLRHAAASARAGQPYDVINVHEPSAALVTLRRRSLGGARIVVTSHGLERRGWNLRLAPDGEPGDRPSGRTRVIYPATLLAQADFGLRKADHIFCLNLEDKAYLATHYGRNGASVTRIFPGAHPVFGRRAAERDYSRAKTILFAGTWLIRKGILDLIPAFARLARHYPDLELKILNPGVDEPTILSQFPEDVRSRVKHVLARPEEGTAQVMEESDIFVLPSRFEGTPLTMMEAMWSGLPVVSTAVCGMKDVIAQGGNGLLVEPGQSKCLEKALETLVRDPALRRRLGQQANADARGKYGWGEASVAVRKAYESLMKQPGSARPSAPLRGIEQTSPVSYQNVSE